MLYKYYKKQKNGTEKSHMNLIFTDNGRQDCKSEGVIRTNIVEIMKQIISLHYSWYNLTVRKILLKKRFTI